MTDLVTGEPYSLRTRAILASNGLTHEEIRGALVGGGQALKDYDGVTAACFFSFVFHQ